MNCLDGNSHLLVEFQIVVISKAFMKGCEIFSTIFKRTVPQPRAQAFAGWRCECLLYGIYPLTCIFSVGSVFTPAYVALVGSLINTMLAMAWIPLQAKPKSDHHVMEDSKSLVFLISNM